MKRASSTKEIVHRALGSVLVIGLGFSACSKGVEKGAAETFSLAPIPEVLPDPHPPTELQPLPLSPLQPEQNEPGYQRSSDDVIEYIQNPERNEIISRYAVEVADAVYSGRDNIGIFDAYMPSTGEWSSQHPEIEGSVYWQYIPNPPSSGSSEDRFMIEMDRDKEGVYSTSSVRSITVNSSSRGRNVELRDISVAGEPPMWIASYWAYREGGADYDVFKASDVPDSFMRLDKAEKQLFTEINQALTDVLEDNGITLETTDLAPFPPEHIQHIPTIGQEMDA